MKNSNVISLLLSLLFLYGLIVPSQAQTDKELLADLIEEEQEAVNALVLYPADTRLAIFQSTVHPEALVKMETIQTRTSTAFREMMESLPESSQKIVWDLSRYPGLIHQLALIRTGSSKSIEDVLANYPEVIHRRAKDASENHDLPLVLVDELNQAAESAFKSILDEYPPAVQQSLQELISLPEVLTILTENIRLTLLVGHVYEKEPEWVLHMADSMNLEVARQNAQELEDWKESLKNDPKAMEELNASVTTYNEEYGYDDDYYEYEQEEVIVRHHYYHYPYWFGYPYWYEYPRWRYYPSWYDWGFHYYPNRPVVIIGLPSFHFTFWFFHHPHHYSHYNHLSAHFVNHYHGHRRSGSSISTTVNNWHHRNQNVISESWLKNDGRLPNRFKEYGKFESSREKYNKKNPKQTISRKDYVKRNEKQYPNLSKSTKEQQIKKDVRKKTIYKDSAKPKVTKPRINQPKKTKDTVKPKVTKPKVKKSKTKDTKVSPKRKKDSTFQRPESRAKQAPKVNRGKDYHKNTWEKSKTRRTQPRVTTRPRVKPKAKKKPRKPNRRKNRDGE